MFDIQLRDVPEHFVVAEQRTVAQAELSDYLIGAMARVHKRALDHGGVAGTDAWPYLRRDDRAVEPIFFVIYDGNPNEGPVPVEVCAPVSANGADLVRQPAHREAFIRLTKTHVASIGQAYEAIGEWITGQGLKVDGAPREVFFTDFPAAAGDDDVFDVAFPVA